MEDRLRPLSPLAALPRPAADRSCRARPRRRRRRSWEDLERASVRRGDRGARCGGSGGDGMGIPVGQSQIWRGGYLRLRDPDAMPHLRGRRLRPESRRCVQSRAPNAASHPIDAGLCRHFPQQFQGSRDPGRQCRPVGHRVLRLFQGDARLRVATAGSRRQEAAVGSRRKSLPRRSLQRDLHGISDVRERPPGIDAAYRRQGYAPRGGADRARQRDSSIQFPVSGVLDAVEGYPQAADRRPPAAICGAGREHQDDSQAGSRSRPRASKNRRSGPGGVGPLAGGRLQRRRPRRARRSPGRPACRTGLRKQPARAGGARHRRHRPPAVPRRAAPRRAGR